MNKENSITGDAGLIKLFRDKGDKEAVGELFRRHSSMAVSVAMKYLKSLSSSEDIVMQVFLKLFDLLKQHEIREFRPWLCQVVRNECLMELRKNKEAPGRSDEDEKRLERIMESREMDHPELKVDLEEKLEKMEELLNTLDDSQRICIELFYLQKKSYREIESITGFSFLQVKSFIQNGKRNLQIRMKKEYDG